MTPSRSAVSWRIMAVRAAAVLLAALLTWGGYVLTQAFLLRRRLEGVIRVYNSRLISATSTLDPRRMKEVSGPDELTRVTQWIVKLSGEGKYMASRLDRLRVISVRASRNEAIVLTEEDWRYQEYDKRTKRPLTGVTLQHQRLRYSMGLDAGRWRVELSELVPQGDGADR